MSQKETKYICYTGIGSNKTGTHTVKDFLKRMEKNRNNFNEPVPKSVKTLDQWIKCSGANKGRCKTKKKPFKFKITPKQIKKVCRKECNKVKKTMPLVMKSLGLDKQKMKDIMKDHNQNCEKNCYHLMKDDKMIKKMIRGMGELGREKRGGGSKKKRKRNRKRKSSRKRKSRRKK